MSNLNRASSGADKPFHSYLTGAGPWPRPGIVLLQEIFGVNDAMRAAADQFAADSFVVLVPDLFHHIQHINGEREIATKCWQALVDEQVRRDVEGAVATLRKHPVCNGKVAIVGFCLGGKYALLAARRGLIDAAVSFYPVGAQTYQQDLETLQCPVMVQLGDDDAHIPEELQSILKSAMDKPQHDYRLHPGAGHGFYNAVRGFHPQAAALAHTQAVEFIKAALGAPL